MRSLLQIKNHHPADDFMLLLSLGYAILDNKNLHIKIPRLCSEPYPNKLYPYKTNIPLYYRDVYQYRLEK